MDTFHAVNTVDKYAVAVMKKDRVVEYLMKGKSRKFAKTVFFFLRTDEIDSTTVKITGRAVNKGKGMEWKFLAALHSLVVNQC